MKKTSTPTKTKNQSRRSSDKISKQLKTLISFKDFDKNVLENYISGYKSFIDLHRDLYGNYIRFKEDYKDKVSQAIAEMFEKNNKNIIKSLKNKINDENPKYQPYKKIINEVLTNNATTKYKDIDRLIKEIYTYCYDIHKSLLKAWNNEELSLADRDFLHILYISSIKK